MTEGQCSGTRFRKHALLYFAKYINLLKLMFFSIGAKIAFQESCNKVLKTIHAFFFLTEDNKAKQSKK